MIGYERVRDGLREGTANFMHLDAAQLVKHAFGLRSAVHREGRYRGKQPVLFYVFAEPREWPDGRSIPTAHFDAHRAEVSQFAEEVSRDEVAFRACSYRTLLEIWCQSQAEPVRTHATAVLKRFAI